MALVTISGYPCSGKSTRAHEIARDFERRIAESSAASGSTAPKYSVVVVDDDGCHVTRAAYDDSRAEKPARAALFTAATRSLSVPHTITILDSANYIKGFRYQLYCAAREAGVRVATVRVAAPPAMCAEWHEAREVGERYKPETFDNLIQRYEEPNSMQRWDSPLFTLPHDEPPPLDDIWAAATSGFRKGPTGAVAERPAPPPGTLQVLTSTTAAIVTALREHLSAGGDGGVFRVPSPPAPPGVTLELPVGRKVTLAELQRHKRAFESAQVVAQKSGSRGAGAWSEGEVAVGFVTYLQSVWGV